MATEWRDLGNGHYVLLSGSNIGAIVEDGRALLIDAGLDKDGVKKALKGLDATGVRVAALCITHGHADHFGGAGWLIRQHPVPVLAAPLEAALVAYPLLEPLFLNGGAAPMAELRGKFTLAQYGAPVSQLLHPGRQHIAGFDLDIVPLPGHAPEQIGVAHGDVLYCGDVLFPKETLERHPILFCADMDAWLETLERLPSLAYRCFVPGHGEPMVDVTSLATLHGERLREIRALVWSALTIPQEQAYLLRVVAAHYAINFAEAQFYLLARTTIQSALTSLQRAGEARVEMYDNRMLWQRT